MPDKFTYPFCYVPHPLVVEAATELMSEISSRPELAIEFGKGKMLGVLVTDSACLYAFSGTVAGSAEIPGFVPPIYDLTAPGGYYRNREAEISSMQDGPLKSAASAELQDWIFDRFIVLNALGERKSVKEIFAARGLVPPGGTGECAAPRLLQHAYLHGMKPLAMGEFWYGESPRREVREHGRFYPSCTGKCGPLLTYMLQGLDVEANPLDTGFAQTEPRVLYEDDSIIVVDKPSGMLSVPGRTSAPSLLFWLRERYGESVESCHRLDMDTSGLMVFARTMQAKVSLEAQFAAREVTKIYRARLVAASTPFAHMKTGTIALPLSADYYDRPRQMVDFENGKLAVTEYEVLQELPNGELDVRFRPRTGRTHQLRVHSAHGLGLGRPIKGDRLYGSADGGILFLCAESLTFRHPETQKEMSCDLTATTHTNHKINNTKTNNQ